MSPRRCARAAGVAAAGILIVAACGYAFRPVVFGWIGRQLVHEDEVGRVDAIVVLSGGGAGRELEAADLFLEGVAPVVALTHDPEDPVLESLAARGLAATTSLDFRQQMLRDLGVPPAAIVVVNPMVMSTADEGDVIARWADARRIRAILVVSSMFHTGRVDLVFRQRLESRGISLRVRGVRSERFSPDLWWRNRADLRVGLIEWQKLVFYRVRY